MIAHLTTSTLGFFHAAGTRVRSPAHVASTTPHGRRGHTPPSAPPTRPGSTAVPRCRLTACLRRSNPHRRISLRFRPTRFLSTVAAVIRVPHPGAVAPHRHTKNALRLRQAGEGAVRRVCSARRNGTPGGILPLRVCTVLPRGDPFVAVRTRDGHVHADAGAERVRCQPKHSPLAPPAGHTAAGCLPHGIPDGRSDSGFGSHAEAGIQRGIRVPRQTMETTRRGRQVLVHVVHVGLPEPALRLPPWRSSARSASP